MKFSKPSPLPSKNTIPLPSNEERDDDTIESSRRVIKKSNVVRCRGFVATILSRLLDKKMRDREKRLAPPPSPSSLPTTSAPIQKFANSISRFREAPHISPLPSRLRGACKAGKAVRSCWSLGLQPGSLLSSSFRRTSNFKLKNCSIEANPPPPSPRCVSLSLPSTKDTDRVWKAILLFPSSVLLPETWLARRGSKVIRPSR